MNHDHYVNKGNIIIWSAILRKVFWHAEERTFCCIQSTWSVLTNGCVKHFHKTLKVSCDDCDVYYERVSW